MQKKAFTLPEILIVLSLIGILTAIILPVAFNSAPDENVMKFKKANGMMGDIVTEIINSDKFYCHGDFGLKPLASTNECSEEEPYGDAVGAKYFCKTFADVVSTTEVNCSDSTEGSGQAYVILSGLSESDMTTAQETLDTYCANNIPDEPEIITADGSNWYQIAPGVTFATMNGATRRFGTIDSALGFDVTYRVMCMDIDGLETGEAPFGYGIRADGKLLYGARAHEWIEKGVQKGS